MRRRTTSRSGWRLLVALIAILSLVAAACGDDGAEDTTTTIGGETTTTTGGETTTTADGETTTTAPDGTTTTVGALPDLTGESVEVAAVWSGSEQDRFQAVLDRFSEETGAEVTFTSTGDDISAVLGPRLEGGNPPTVAMLPQPGLLQDFANRGALVPIEDAVGELVDENYASVWRELGTVDGELYGLWFKAANKSTVWYDQEKFDTAGVQPPEDWEGFLSTAQTISDAGIVPISIGADVGWPLTDWFENVYVRSAGPEMYDQLAAHEIPWTDDSVIDAMNLLAEVWGNEQYIGSTETALQNDFNASVTRVFADTGEAAMVYEGDFVAGVISAETNATPGEDAFFFAFPDIEGSPPAVIGAGDVAVLFEDSDAGRALMQFLASPTAPEIWAEQGGFLSPNQGLDLSVYPDDLTRDLAGQLVEAEVFRFDMSDLQPGEFGSTTGQGMWGLFTELLRDPDQVERIAQELEDAASRAFGE